VPAPSVPFNTIPAGDLDPDSPITTELMTDLADRSLFCAEWIGAKAAAQINHRHRGLGTDGTDNVDYANLVNVAGISAMSTSIVHNYQLGNVAFGSPVIGFFPRALILRTGVRVFAPAADTMSWGTATPGLGTTSIWISPYAVGAPQGYASQFQLFDVAYDAGNAQTLACAFLGAPGMGATFLWSGAPGAGGRYTSIMITAIE